MNIERNFTPQQQNGTQYAATDLKEPWYHAKTAENNLGGFSSAELREK